MRWNSAWVARNQSPDNLETYGKTKYYWSKKITPNGTLLYSHISFLLSHHERHFLLQQMGIQRPTARHRVQSQTLEHTTLKEMSPSNHPPQSKGDPTERAGVGETEGTRRTRHSKTIEQSSQELRLKQEAHGACLCYSFQSGTCTGSRV